MSDGDPFLDTDWPSAPPRATVRRLLTAHAWREELLRP